MREYRATPKRKAYMRAHNREYRATPERKAYMREYMYEYLTTSQGKDVIRAKNHRRRAAERNLPNNWTPADMTYALDYFGGCCAYCGRPLNGIFHMMAFDHYIAVNDKRADNPGTVPTNMLPACHARKDAPAGTPACNNGKHNKPPEVWLVERFGKRKAATIIARIEAFFETVRRCE
jgi:hypothetical protein